MCGVSVTGFESERLPSLPGIADDITVNETDTMLGALCGDTVYSLDLTGPTQEGG